MKELEQQISQLRKKMTEQEKMLKMKDQTDKSVCKLQGEIQVNPENNDMYMQTKYTHVYTCIS